VEELACFMKHTPTTKRKVLPAGTPGRARKREKFNTETEEFATSGTRGKRADPASEKKSIGTLWEKGNEGVWGEKGAA